MDELYDKVIAEHLDTRRPEPEREDLVDVLLRVQKDSNQVIALSSDHIKGVNLVEHDHQVYFKTMVVPQICFTRSSQFSLDKTKIISTLNIVQ